MSTKKVSTRVVAELVRPVAPLGLLRAFVMVGCGFAASCVGGREDQTNVPSGESPEDSSGGAMVSGGSSSGGTASARGGRFNNTGGLGGARVATGGSSAVEGGREGPSAEGGDGGAPSEGGNGGAPSEGGDGGAYGGRTSDGGGAGASAGSGGGTRPELPKTSFDLSRPINSLSSSERDQFCLELVGATLPLRHDPEWVRCVAHFPSYCDWPLRSYATCFVQGDYADLNSQPAGVICRAHMELDLGLPGYWLAGSVSETELDWRDGRHPVWMRVDQPLSSVFWLDASWPQGSLHSWQLADSDEYAGLLGTWLEGGAQRWRCLDQIAANRTPHYLGDALESSGLSELACDASGGEPFDLQVSGKRGEQPLVEGSAFGAPLSGWSVAHRFDCSDFDCRFEFRREDGSIVAIALRVQSTPLDDHSSPKLGPYYEPRKEYDLTELPFTAAALLTQDGLGTIACGSGGTLVQEIVGEPYIHDSLAGSGITEIRYHYTDKLTLHMDHLAAPAACPGTPVSGMIGCTQP